MSYLQTVAPTHARKVRSLYKQAIRLIQAYYECFDRPEFRYQAVLMRARFDENKNEIDLRKAKKILLDGQKELFLKSHPQPIKFPLSPGGVAYQRTSPAPDWVSNHGFTCTFFDFTICFPQGHVWYLPYQTPGQRVAVATPNPRAVCGIYLFPKHQIC
ncbi:unnamed protein product [Lymnaea stagnalis]|uniref:NADH dehydrogenase [ubiquinone] 1 beta subcomplex subunit 9 n=1 Tax=Lymnaea stagnalis TaxID=6523 RepID=A0AAV2HG68_LYMST